MPPQFPHTEVKSVRFSNYSGTVNEHPVALYCTPAGGTERQILRAHGDALRAILRHCFTQSPPATLRTIGSAWSFSRVIEPGDVILDCANFTFIQPIPNEFYTQDYRARAARGFVPMFVEGGTQIASVNRRFGGDVRLALQTSGAGDGHRIAGCIATGTHGSALGIGAVHDTVLGIYLVVGPDQALFIQSGSAQFCSSEVAPWLEEQTGIPTDHRANDELFHAALVSLGSLGVVFGVVIEATPLYRLKYKSTPFAHDDDRVWNAIRTLDTSALHPETVLRPYHFDIVMHPYPPDGPEPGLVATLMWKVPAGNVSLDSPLPALPRTSSDRMGLIANIAAAVGRLPIVGPISFAVVRSLIADQLELVEKRGEAFPGQMFGPTTLPPGTGASTEVVVNHADAERALKLVLRVLHDKSTQGQFLLGAIGVRFVPKTNAHLGMNIFDMNCYIELPSIRNAAVLEIYRAVWDALDTARIPFTCHWGQLHGMNPTRLARYFGPRAESWRAARSQLLDETARSVFASPILREVGLDG
jgi:FAD/FMN-containing dehydrogenase